ncbi:hypothetical protein J7T55_004343 [Diaporthe amygdali]|uniref:uncharacterized protein n=1 Tax=Phomopsis amygdali TaxID=1214568 RepID=UPI0022FF2FB8|nr:uncharacterized protein J7T55_004343 [Diaporthe amygdali]KAJ0109793.1 hypothetical protein J7T55_004343 [Diaporthe amygdali]
MDRSTGHDGEIKGDSVTFVALFDQEVYAIEANSPVNGWVVDTKQSEKKKGANAFKIILRPGHLANLQNRRATILSSTYLHTGNSNLTQFKKGKPLITLFHPIRACIGKSRPNVLYRAVHDCHPGNGLYSRGFGTVKNDPMSFMEHFCRHLNWKRRDPSPFMSTTSHLSKAVNVARWYERNGFSGIEVLVIKMDKEWREQSKVWKVNDILATLGRSAMRKASAFEHEYLIEEYIPASCVSRLQWEKVKGNIRAQQIKGEPGKKRKRSLFESDGREGESELGNE